MILISVVKEQPDLFNPDKELVFIVESENLIDGTKTKMRVLPNNLQRYKDKIIRDELVNTVTRMINHRYNNYKHSVLDAPPAKWNAVKILVDKSSILTSFKNTYAVSKYIQKHLMHWLVTVTPGQSSRFHYGYTQKLQALDEFTKQQILAFERAKKVENLKEEIA